ncbi:MAG: hypothetical protein ACTHN5_12175 [Phycisphaerae bacterium]
MMPKKRDPLVVVHFRDHQCVLVLGSYKGNHGVPMMLLDRYTGEIVAIPTEKVGDVELKRNQVFIKDYGRDRGVLKALEEAGVVRNTGLGRQTGPSPAPLCEYLIHIPESSGGHLARRIPARDQFRSRNFLGSLGPDGRVL